MSSGLGPEGYAASRFSGKESRVSHDIQFVGARRNQRDCVAPCNADGERDGRACPGTEPYEPGSGPALHLKYRRARRPETLHEHHIVLCCSEVSQCSGFITMRAWRLMVGKGKRAGLGRDSQSQHSGENVQGSPLLQILGTHAHWLALAQVDDDIT